MSGLFCVTLFRTRGCTPCDACAPIPADFAAKTVCWRRPFPPQSLKIPYYVDGKSVADKLRSIRFEKSRQKYKSEHDDTLRTFYMAERKLKPYFKDGKLPITAWRREREQLEQEYRDIQTELSPLHADAKKLWAIHYNIYEVQHEQERQNTATRQKKQEIEH